MLLSFGNHKRKHFPFSSSHIEIAPSSSLLLPARLGISLATGWGEVGPDQLLLHSICWKSRLDNYFSVGSSLLGEKALSQEHSVNASGRQLTTNSHLPAISPECRGGSGRGAHSCLDLQMLSEQFLCCWGVLRGSDRLCVWERTGEYCEGAKENCRAVSNSYRKYAWPHCESAGAQSCAQLHETC